MAQSPQDNVIKKVLPNGLTVLFKEDRSNPVVAINMWFKVGSVNETEEENGLAHFQEHMVFKGTERHGVGEIAKLVKSAGGNLNAATSYSYTMYYVVLPAQAFSLGLDVQADAMMNSTFAPEEFQKERLVVIDEARMYDDTPDAYTFYRTMELGFKMHNYRRPIAGYEKVVRKFTREQLIDFYKRYYRPGNAVLAIVGAVEPKAALAQIEKTYGSWQNGSVSVNESPAEPPQTEFRFNTMRGSIDHAYFSLGFHVPSILDADYPALEMLSTLIGSGKSSRLYRTVFEKKHLVTTVSAELLAEKWPGYFMVFASTPPEKWNAARDAICEEIARFQNEAVGEEELVKARRQVEKAMYSELETVEGQASNFGYYEVLGDYRLAEMHRQAIHRVTPEQVLHVARKYFRIDNGTMVSYLPENATIEAPERDRVAEAISGFIQSFPADSPAPERTVGGGGNGGAKATTAVAAGVVPQVEVSELPNGLKVLVKRRETVPMISMLTVVQGGNRLEPAGKSGLSTLGARTLLKGTESYDADDIVETIEGLGGSIESFSSFDVTGTYTNILAAHLDDALPVYKEIARVPKFSGDTIRKEKDKLIEELARRRDHPVSFSIDCLFTNAFGDHPYARPYVQDESQLTALTEKDCAGWHRSILVPGNMTMVFVGDITMEKALAAAGEVYGDLEAGAVPESSCRAPQDAVGPGLHELSRPGLKQAVGLVGFVAPPMMSEEAIALGVLNGIMTGLGGRLFVELRDKRSLGYMAGSAFAPLKERSIFYGYSNPGADGIDEALEVILAELERVAKEPVTDEELRRSKEWLAGSQTMKLQRNISQAVEYGTYEALGFGYGVVDEIAGIIRAVTKERIQKAAAAVFDREKAVRVRLVPEA